MSSSPSLKIRYARPDDLPSLVTILPRSFHPVNPYMRRCFPDTTVVRAWWQRIFQDQIQDSACDILVAALDDESTDGGEKIKGILCLRRWGPDEKGAGIWTKHDLTADHDVDACMSVFFSMAESREQLMSGKPHLCIELFGVDHTFKGQRLGVRMLSRAGKIADEQSLATFVQANTIARGFYEKLGFELRHVVVMPGDDKYEENMLVRPATIAER